MSRSQFHEEREARVHLLLKELRHELVGPIKDAAPGYAGKKADAYALNDRLNLEANEKSMFESEDITKEFEGILEKLSVSGGRHSVVEALKRNKELFFTANRKINPNPVGQRNNLDPISTKILKLLLLLAGSPSTSTASAHATGVADRANERESSAKLGREDSHSVSEGEEDSDDPEELRDWMNELESPTDAHAWESDSDSDLESEANSTEGGDAFSRDMHPPDEFQDNGTFRHLSSARYVTPTPSPASGWNSQNNLKFGAHITHFSVTSTTLREEFSDRYTSARNPPQVQVYPEYDVCRMVSEMLLGSPNDFFLRKDIAWGSIFTTAPQHRDTYRKLPSFDQVPDIRKDCRVFKLSHYALNARLPCVGSDVLKGMLEWFADLGSDMDICRKFGTFYEDNEFKRRSAEPKKKLVEGLRSQVLEQLTHITKVITEYQTSLLEEGRNTNATANIDGGEADMMFIPLSTPRQRCSLIHLYSHAHKWKSTLSSMVAFIHTLLHFSLFQSHGMKCIPSKSGDTRGGIVVSRKGTSNGESEQLFEFMMTFKMMQCLHHGVCTSNFNISNAIHSLFKKDDESTEVGPSFAMRRSHYMDTSLVRVGKGPALWQYAVFERFTFTHFLHYFVESCCKSVTFVRDQNYILKAGDVFSKSKATFLCSRHGGLMKVALPYIEMLDRQYLQENRSISRYARLSAAGKVNWKQQIKDVKCLADYKSTPSNTDKSTKRESFTEKLTRDMASLENQRDNLLNMSRIDSIAYLREYFRAIEDADTGDTDRAAMDASPSQALSDAFLLNFLPVPTVQEIFFIKPILDARTDVQIAVIEGIWEHFSLKSYFTFFRNVFLVGNDELYTPFREHIDAVMDLKNRTEKLPKVTVKLCSNLIQSFTSAIKALTPSIGVLHSSISLDENKLLPSKVSPGSVHFSQIVDELVVELHFAYPLGEMFSDTIMTQYTSIQKFLLRLSLCEGVLKTAWVQSTTNRYCVDCLDNSRLLADLRAAGRDETLCNYAMCAKSWYSFMRKSRLALGLAFRVCTDLRAYHLRLVHSKLWTKFEQVLNDTDTTGSSKASPWKLKSVAEVRDCHATFLDTITQSTEQFSDVLKTLLFTFSNFAEVIYDATVQEASLVRGLYSVSTLEYAQLGRHESIAKQFDQQVANYLNQLENVLKLFRTQLDQVVRSETLSHVFDGFRELRDMLQ